MKVCLIVTTYNWSEALELSLLSALEQTRLPDEIIIADDGSTEKTKAVIDEIAKESSVKIIHSWQKDNGFRAARSRNLAISKSTSDYVICIDGDLILDSRFIADHCRCVTKHYYLQGSRVLLSPDLTIKTLNNRSFVRPRFWSKGVRNKLNNIYNRYLSKIICNKGSTKQKGIKSCNFSFYKEDFIAVNGFNEDFTTWGREDSEFINRLYNNGILRKNLKLSGIQYHLHHQEGTSNSQNDGILDNAIQNNLTWINNGLDKHLGDR